MGAASACESDLSVGGVYAAMLDVHDNEADDEHQQQQHNDDSQRYGRRSETGERHVKKE